MVRNIEPQERAGTTSRRFTDGHHVAIYQQTVILHRQLDGIEAEIARRQSRIDVPETGAIECHLYHVHDLYARALVNEHVQGKSVAVVQRL